MIYVTHDQTEAMTLGNRIVVMKDGVIQQIDTPSQVYNKPANKFVAGFIGSPQMNFLKGRIIKKLFMCDCIDRNHFDLLNCVIIQPLYFWTLIFADTRR